MEHYPYRIPMARETVLDQAMSNVDMRDIKGIKTEQDEDGKFYVDIELSPYEAVFYYLGDSPAPKARGTKSTKTAKTTKSKE